MTKKEFSKMLRENQHMINPSDLERYRDFGLRKQGKDWFLLPGATHSRATSFTRDELRKILISDKFPTHTQGDAMGTYRIRREAVESTAKVIGLTLGKNGKSDFSSWKQTHDGYRFHRWELVAKGFNRQIFLTLEDVDLFLSNHI